MATVQEAQPQVRLAELRQHHDNNCVVNGEVSQACVDANCQAEEVACFGRQSSPATQPAQADRARGL